MNEVRQVWTSIRSSRSYGSASVTEGNDERTTWYDSPAPVIVHNRDFDAVNMEVIVKNAEKSGKAEDGAGAAVVEEVLYQNNVEAALNSLSKVCAEPLKSELEADCAANVDSADEKSARERRRHSSSIELTATSSLKVDEDGMPRISFSFLGAEEPKSGRVDLIVTRTSAGPRPEAVDAPEETLKVDAVIARDELYDFPKSPALRGRQEIEIESRVARIKGPGVGEEESPEDAQDEWYDVPRSVKGALDVRGKNSGPEDADEEKQDLDSDGVPTSPSPTPGRPPVESESERNSGTRDGILSNSGSCSDIESVDGSPDARGSVRERRLKRQRKRLGKAWGKMRNWLKEEKSKIGDVVARHAKMQAVGAMSNDDNCESGTATVGLRNQSGSYDLTRQRKFDVGSITRVEEFGLSSVSEEGQASETDGLRDVDESVVDPTRVSRSKDEEELGVEDDPGRSPDSNKSAVELTPASNARGNLLQNSFLRKKTKSSENILTGTKLKFTPVSFSLDKLCSDGENEENNAASESDTSKEHSTGKGAGLIKRRMLGSIRGLMASTHLLQTHEIEEGGQGGFEDVRRYVKQGGDFCKELAAILHERAELEATYAKGLSKLGGKLTKACSREQGGNSAGSVSEAWRCIGEEMDAAAEAHRVWGIALGEQLAKPLRVGVAEAQGRARKVIENSVDKSAKSLQEWRNVATKSKKQSFSCARENERLQDLARIQSMSQGQQNNNKLQSNHQMTEKEANKLEARRRKSEDASRRADTEFYTISVRAERARLEYESTIRKGAKQMELLEEERLSALKDLANVYLAHLHALSPRLQQSSERLDAPVHNSTVLQDIEILRNLTRRIDNNESTNAEQLLPDFYAEHVTLAMNRERRKQALIRVLHLIRQDLDREKRGREGLETLHRAFIKTPAFAADESTQNVTEKLHHMRSMLTYLEAARYKVGGALSEIEGGKRGKHPLAQHILVSRDRQGLQQSVLKVPNWVKTELPEQLQANQNDLDDHLTKDRETDNRDWADRTAGDGNSENPPDEEDFSDFDEFSNHSEDNNNQEIDTTNITAKNNRSEQCRAIYQYSANLNDELSLIPGDLITIHEKQADGWWVGECRGRTGIFPATYVQVIH